MLSLVLIGYVSGLRRKIILHRGHYLHYHKIQDPLLPTIVLFFLCRLHNLCLSTVLQSNQHKHDLFPTLKSMVSSKRERERERDVGEEDEKEEMLPWLRK